MKASVVLYSICLFSITYAQTDPYSYLSRIPGLPDNACSFSDEQKSTFINKSGDIHKEIKAEITRLRKKAESGSLEQEKQVKENLAKQYGLSDADIKKMKNAKNMSEAEKKALVEKMMNQARNTQVDQKKAMDSYQLSQEQKNLNEKIFSQDTAFQNRLKELDNSDTTASRELSAVIDPLRIELSKINDGEGGTEQDAVHRREVLKKIQDAEIKYCGKMTPLYYKILNDRLAVITASMPDYKRVEEITSQLNKNTTGIDKDISIPGLYQLEAIEEYISLLGSVFKFARYSYTEY